VGYNPERVTEYFINNHTLYIDINARKQNKLISELDKISRNSEFYHIILRVPSYYRAASDNTV
jgi:hypothetical protein